jgi:hypothetical protein
MIREKEILPAARVSDVRRVRLGGVKRTRGYPHATRSRPRPNAEGSPLPPPETRARAFLSPIPLTTSGFPHVLKFNSPFRAKIFDHPTQDLRDRLHILRSYPADLGPSPRVLSRCGVERRFKRCKNGRCNRPRTAAVPA